MTGPVRARLPDGRAHFQHGPIDLVISAEGPAHARQASLEAAWERFSTILVELVGELARLRTPLGEDEPGLQGTVARRMAAAARPHAARAFVTPMVAVAGAVADETLAAMTGAASLSRAAVNNGGDVAIHLSPGTQMRFLVASHAGERLGLADVAHGEGIGGIATSGRHGRSHCLGIADSVTVIAATAAGADAAATMIANAVDLPGHPAVERVPAADLAPDSDLGDRPVTVACGALSAGERARALSAGAALARALEAEGRIAGAFLHLQGETVVTGRAAAAAIGARAA
jgi:ApbE superfamily uncharacterized protein (UPF0280 family)